LLKGLLGEVPHSKGKIYVAKSRLSWCEQAPWIMVSNAPFSHQEES
jgi:ATP-binding cassette subfamily C (CFTR/MRP) protein 1